jgi:hypothetical protein
VSHWGLGTLNNPRTIDRSYIRMLYDMIFAPVGGTAISCPFRICSTQIFKGYDNLFSRGELRG